MGIVRFYGAVIWFAIALAMTGQLKACTLVMLGKAAESNESGMTSYSKFTKRLWGP